MVVQITVLIYFDKITGVLIFLHSTHAIASEWFAFYLHSEWSTRNILVNAFVPRGSASE